MVVPATGHVFLQEDAEDVQYVRGVDRRGRIYDFAKTLLNNFEFCGGCFSPDGKTFFLNQQGGRQDGGPDGTDPLNPPDETTRRHLRDLGPVRRARASLVAGTSSASSTLHAVADVVADPPNAVEVGLGGSSTSQSS